MSSLVQSKIVQLVVMMATLPQLPKEDFGID
jgi:hypothetical protein